MMYRRKALSMPMEAIVAIVVFLVIALAVIMFSSGGLRIAGGTAQESTETASLGLQCQSAAKAWCAAHTAPTDTTCRSGAGNPCSICPSDMLCAK